MEQAMRKLPWATFALIFAIITVTVGFSVAFNPLDENLERFALFVNQHSLSAVPSRVLAFYSVPYFLKAAGGYLTAPFIHDGWPHMVMSAIPLAFFGPSVEKAIGWKGMLVVFLLGSIGGEIGSSAMLLSLSDNDSSRGTIGASPAIYAIIAVFIVVAYTREWRKYWIGLSAAWVILLLEIAASYSAYLHPTLATAANHASHVSGFLIGLALTWWLLPRASDNALPASA
jgi:membrane associated rhomboid family serine protease